MIYISKLFVSLLIILGLISGCSQEKDNNNSVEETLKTEEASFPYPIVKWNNQIYRITSTDVESIDEKIGEIENYSTNEQLETPDNYSNFYDKGTTLWSIKDIKTADSIAIKAGDSYVKASIVK
ncbi:hypothetical protein [Niallia taxi]|uniref:hypothetical protein n=1 Tax=Niallia taxi TaxID=2499688 RepID=UPI0021A4A854|nr:hypothetical protein [Niallia taxi]MCT2347245.1 hypothetical protein [Niallia taxi]